MNLSRVKRRSVKTLSVKMFSYSQPDEEFDLQWSHLVACKVFQLQCYFMQS